jgi:hypothetical protein
MIPGYPHESARYGAVSEVDYSSPPYDNRFSQEGHEVVTDAH